METELPLVGSQQVPSKLKPKHEIHVLAFSSRFLLLVQILDTPHASGVKLGFLNHPFEPVIIIDSNKKF
jgi:hypothetical protein